MNAYKTGIVTVECLVDGTLTDVAVRFQCFQAIGMENPVWKPVEVDCERDEQLMCNRDRCPARDSLG